MSNSLQPWIRDYIVDIAETYGANLSNIPLYPKKKKVQITKFLTYGSDNDGEATLIWAEASDKQHLIPIKFTKEAVGELRESFIYGAQRITQHIGAIINITNFKPIFTRVPQSSKLSTDPYLVIECTSFNILGSSGEATFGNPLPITQSSDVQLWSDGLKSDGGAGNILKEKKIQRESGKAARPTNPKSNSLRPIVQQTSLPDLPDVIGPQIHTSITRNKIQDLATYEAQWLKVTKDHDFRCMTTESTQNDRVSIIERAVEKEVKITPVNPGMEIDAINVDPPRSRSGTPISTWEATPSKRGKSPTINPSQSSKINLFASSSILPLPTPGQRMRVSTVKRSPEVHSSFPSGNETVLESGSHGRNTVVPRKIPRPTSPAPAKYSGPVRILAPNSDTSGTQSQPSQEEPTMRRRLLQGIDMEEAGEYPWIDMWRIRDIMEKTVQARAVIE